MRLPLPLFLIGPLMAGLLGMSGLLAAQDLALYEGETPVSGQQQGERDAALPRALAQMLIKLSGDPGVAGDAAISASLNQAGALLQQYRYNQIEGSNPGTPGWMLVASFQRAGVDALLAAAGRRTWPSPRPEPIVWLAIDDGRGPRLVGTAQAQAVAALTQRGRMRGLRLTYPLLDLEDQQAIDAGRVWNFDLGAVRAATARYPTQVALIGRLQRDNGGWTIDWRLLDAGESAGQVRLTDADPAVLLAAGATLAADKLALRYASQVEDSGPPGSYSIWVEPIRTAEDYARLIGYLNGLSLVRASQPVRADGERLHLDLDLGSGIDGFSRLVERGGVLQPLPGAEVTVRGFRLQP